MRFLLPRWDAFRAGDIWLARSRRYGDIRKALLSAPAVADADRSLPAPASPHDWLAERRFALDAGLRRLAAAARAGAVAGGSIEDSVLRVVERTETAVPDGAADLVADLYRRMPEARITDILFEVDDATRFTEALHPPANRMSWRRPCGKSAASNAPCS